MHHLQALATLIFAENVLHQAGFEHANFDYAARHNL
jgi:hypothetical protein